jgi:diacylglycerol kinase family enzyme
VQLLRRRRLYASLALLAVLLLAPRTHAGNLTITSSPPGATIEIDGSIAGTTPFHIKYPGGYFHKPHSVFGERLEHSVKVRISMKGYAAKETVVTDGPFDWVSLNGHHHGKYWLLTSDHFDIHLEPLAKPSEVSFETVQKAGPLRPAPENAHAALEHATPESGSVMFTSETSNVEIFVDGKFMGQAPATIRLAIGSHRIEVKSTGRRTWTRELEVLKDSQLTLHPVLEQQP